MAKAKAATSRLRTWLENLSVEKQQRLRAWTARGILLIAGLALFLYLCYEGGEYAEDLEYFVVNPSHVHFTQTPDWVSENVTDEVLSVGALSRPFNIFEPGMTDRIAREIDRSPWVRRVVAVRKRYPNRLAMELELRRPVAYVDYRGTFYAVDRFGVRLPEVARRIEDAPWRLPCVLSGQGEPPAVGEPWPGEIVAHAALVADKIEKSSDPMPVTVVAIDVSMSYRRGRGDPNVTLYTLEGPRVLWGSPPGKERHGEPKCPEKIRNLRVFSRRTGDVARREYVDIRFAEAVYWRDRPVAVERILTASRVDP